MTSSSHDRSAHALAALAQPTRLRIIEVIASGEAEGTPAGVIAREVACPASTLSFHLKELAQAGLLEAHPRGRFIRYAIVPAAFAALAEFVARLPGQPVASEPAPPAGRRRRRRGSKEGAEEAAAPATDAQLSIF